MAKVVITVDTETKTLSVSVDGQGIANVSSFNGYCYTDAAGKVRSLDVSISTGEMVGDVSKSTTYYCCGSAQAKQAETDGKVVTANALPGFVKVTENKSLEMAISSILGR